tara:strand:- start:2977 stop:4182 length:1206 start_codon:yes stop_codon:yes gene_type:complete
MKKKFKYDICIVGGLGHVGLPLGVVFASKDQNVCLYDLNKSTAKTIFNDKKMPFVEHGSSPLLKKVLKNNKLHFSDSEKSINESKNIIIAIGTPIDEFMNPKTEQFLDFIKSIKKHIDNSQSIIIRSSVAPRTCERVAKILGPKKNKNLSYCPERIVQGFAVKELENLPQIVSGYTDSAIKSASKIFKKITNKVIATSVPEAEMAKLFSNSWRYVQFALANQFYMICNDNEINYDNVRFAMVEGYERAAQLPGAGFAAGPCLLKDTMQLSSMYNNNFLLGHSAMMINEGLPDYIIKNILKNNAIKNKKIGILGMAFKAEVDDIRDSLSFKLRKILSFHGANVMCSDEYYEDESFYSTQDIISECKIIIIGAPHKKYKNLKYKKNQLVVDIWKLTEHTNNLF